MESCGSIVKGRSLLISSNPDQGLEPLSWGVPSPRVWNWEKYLEEMVRKSLLARSRACWLPASWVWALLRFLTRGLEPSGSLSATPFPCLATHTWFSIKLAMWFFFFKISLLRFYTQVPEQTTVFLQRIFSPNIHEKINLLGLYLCSALYLIPVCLPMCRDLVSKHKLSRTIVSGNVYVHCVLLFFVDKIS